MLPELESERLVLRETQPEDAAFLEAYQNGPDHWRLQAVEPENFANGVQRVEGYHKYQGSGADRRLYDFVAREKETNTPIGQASLNRSGSTLASIGFSVAKDFRGQGFAVEMAARVIAYGFDELKLHRIAADIAIENEASRRIAEKFGMAHEGTARDCIWAQGKWWTEAKYAILEGDPR